MQKTCKQCRAPFSPSEHEHSLRERISPVFGTRTEPIPSPTLCPDCRTQRRFMQRNERMLYHRTCDLTGKDIVTFYAPDSSYKVFGKDAWWSDEWDALSYGRPFDGSRSFFEQFQALRLSVPRLGMVMTQAEGGQYSPYCVNTKNCYMTVSSLDSEDCYFCYQTNRSKDCVDCAQSRLLELSYECLYCFQLTSSAYCRDCENSSGLYFCTDCRGCKNCIGCKNLVNQEHRIFNRQAKPEEYATMVKQLKKRSGVLSVAKQSMDLAMSLPTRATHLVQCDNCTGDHLRECRNCASCFDAGNMEDCTYVFPIPSGAKDAVDAHYSPGGELLCECLSAVRGQRCRFVLHSWDVNDVTYTDECFSSRNLFGCVGLRHKEYCVLNKQYTREEYERLVPAVIERMRNDEEWGEYFPGEHSPFAYNESLAQQEYPLLEPDVRAQGWRWREAGEKTHTNLETIPAEDVPDDIANTDDSITGKAILCTKTGKPFRIIEQELMFYRRGGIPIPHLHPDERYRRRMALRNPRKLWKRSCAQCQQPIETTYAPDRPEKVVCEACYLKTIY